VAISDPSIAIDKMRAGVADFCLCVSAGLAR
jgi:hypothetical protein